MLRSVKQALTDLFAGDEVERAVLVFTTSGERVLMGRHRFRPLQPTIEKRRFPAEDISVDLPLLADHLIPEITIGSDRFAVNSVDFGVLTRAVVNGDVHEPLLAEQLTPYFEQARALARYDPETFRSMISGEWGSDGTTGRPQSMA